MSKAVKPKLRGNTYWFRKRVPTQLVDYFGFKEWCFSLKTKDYSVALMRAGEEQRQINSNIAKALRRVEDEANDPSIPTLVNGISDDYIQQIVLSWYHETSRKVTEDTRRFIRSSYELPLSKRTERIEQEIVDLKRSIEAFERESVGAIGPIVDLGNGVEFEHSQMSWINEHAKELLAEQGIELDDRSQEFAKLKTLILRGRAEYLRRRLSMINGKPTASTVDRYFDSVDVDKPMPKEFVVSPHNRLTFGFLLDLFLQDKGKSLAPKTILGYEQNSRLLESYFGKNTLISSLERKDFLDFRDMVALLPPNYSKKYKGIDLKLVASIAKEDDLPSIAPRTLNKKFETISAMLNFAVDNDLLDKNYARRLRIPDHQKKNRRGFTIDELNVVFKSPLYVDYDHDPKGFSEKGLNSTKPSQYWIPLIALFHGMRLNEICQLYTEDIKLDDDIYYIAVRNDLDDGSVAPDKRLKTKNSDRIIPVHPCLLKCGFISFVDHKKSLKAARLFGELKYSDKIGSYSDPFQKWFKRFLLGIGVKKDNGRNPCFHSFRHSFRDALRRQNIERDIVQVLGGWKGNSGEEEQYGEGFDVSRLYKEISKVEYEGVDLKHLYLH